MIFKPQFNSEGVLSEYPRPQKQRDSYLCLNGEWDYIITERENLEAHFDGKIILPYSPESEFSGVNRQLKKREFLHLKKDFTLPKGFNKGRVFFNVGACDQTCKVFLNGKLLYENFDGYTSFTVELTNIVDGVNTLYIIVKDDADSPIYGRGKQRYKRGGIWYTAISGIWQSCFLESTPKVYIKDFKFYPDFDNKTLTVTCDISQSEKSAYVSIIDENRVLAEGFAVDGKVTLDASKCSPWTLDNPELYTVIIKAEEDEVKSYFGLRKFSTAVVKGKKYFAINNEPIFLNGLLDQGYYHGGIYTPKTNADMYNEVYALKNMGFNMLRKHIKVEPMLWYYYCDILGMVVFQDMINGGGKYSPFRIMLAPFFNLKLNDGNYKAMRRNADSRKQYKYEANRLIDQLFNVTSIFLWTPFNEAWGQFDALKICEELRKKDSTRLYDHASGWQDMGGGDVCSKHIYFRKIKLKNDNKRVLALTEFGGYSLYLKGHVFSDKKFGYKAFKDQKSLQNAYQNLYFDQIIPMIYKEGLSSCCYTQVSDVEDEINGIYTYDRILKFDPEFLKSVNEKVYKAFKDSLK